jgi:hypothetical protein
MVGGLINTKGSYGGVVQMTRPIITTNYGLSMQITLIV